MIAPTSAEDARYIADNLRDEDRRAIAAWTDEDPAELAYFTATTSPFSWVVYSAMGEPVAMFGADGERGDSYGAAWMYSTPRVSKASMTLIRACNIAIAISRDWWPELRIDAEPRDEKQTAFLEFIGFRERSRETRDGKTFVELSHAEQR